jgi:hypothetical protein
VEVVLLAGVVDFGVRRTNVSDLLECKSIWIALTVRVFGPRDCELDLVHDDCHFHYGRSPQGEAIDAILLH